MAMSASNQETLDQFMSCWEGLEDPRSGNAALHDFHELLVMALCAVLCGGQGAVDMAFNAIQEEGSKGSTRGKFKRAGDDDFLIKLLELFSNVIALLQKQRF